jgi:ADP-heptose:LPS heptosyltransferase
VGISWRSFQPKTRGHVVRKKSAPLETFMKLANAPGLRLLDLQYGDTAAERERFARSGGRLAHLDGLDLFNDLDGVLAAIEACDVVATTSNVTAHLAGALGKRTLLFYPDAISPFHYWVPGADGRCLWYPSVEIVTAPELDTWERLLERVHDLLAG